jgi:hypothetical protein
MKNNLNEQLSRIKGMMGMISEQSFTSPSMDPNFYSKDLQKRRDDEVNGPVTKFSGNKPLYKRVYFNNGGDISIQASRTAYSEPRDNIGPYTHMEMGYPSEGTVLPKNVLKYVEQGGVYNDDGSQNPYKNVYPYVPVSVIKELINANGGIKSGELPPMSDEPMEDDPFVKHGKDDDYESSVENDDYDEKQERNYGVEDLNELGGYIGDAPEKITGPKIAKVDPRIHDGYSGYDVLRAHRLLLNIYSYGDIEMPTEDYLKLSNYMQEIYKSVKYDENAARQQKELDREDMPF